MEYYKEFVLKNGKKLIVRNADLEDAESVAKVANIVHEETIYLSFSMSEKTFTAEEEMAYIEQMNSSKESAFLVGEYDGEIVGTTQITPRSGHNREKHRSYLGIAIIKKFWGLGIAGRMLTAIIECATQIGYEQIELGVVAENTRAFELYKSFGFDLCGTIKSAYKFSQDHYSDSYMMQKFLK